jgi:hypothetical protein
MGEHHLERASTGRSRCKLCKEPIEKGGLRIGVTADSTSFDGTMKIWHHGICAAIRRPHPFLAALKDYLGVIGAEREQLTAIANATKSGKLKQVVWRHATEPRCVLEFPDKYMLVTFTAGKSLVVWGPLNEVIASVPDEDLQDVTDTAIASGKSLARDAPAAKPKPKPGKGRTLRQRFESKSGATTYAYEYVLDEAKHTVTRSSEIKTGKQFEPYGKPTKKKLESLELAQKYFRYWLSQQDSPKVSGDEVAIDPQEDFKDVKDKSSDYRYLEHATTKQFFDIDRDASNVIVVEGAIGTRGTETIHEHNWDGEAKDFYKEQLAAKIAAGYAEPPGFAGRRAAGKKA